MSTTTLGPFNLSADDLDMATITTVPTNSYYDIYTNQTITSNSRLISCEEKAFLEVIDQLLVLGLDELAGMLRRSKY